MLIRVLVLRIRDLMKLTLVFALIFLSLVQTSFAQTAVQLTAVRDVPREGPRTALSEPDAFERAENALTGEPLQTENLVAAAAEYAGLTEERS